MILTNATRIVYGNSSDAVGPSLVPALETIGWARFPETKVHGLVAHRHPVFEICYIEDGAVTWWVEEERFDVCRGDIFYTRPGELHGGADMMMHPCQLFWLQVAPDETTSDIFAAISSEGTRRFPAEEAGLLFAQLHTEHRLPGSFATVAAQATLLQLLITVIRARTAHQQGRVLSRPIVTALDWMAEHLGEPFEVQEAAAAIQMHPSRFHERFLAEVGQTPAEWRVRQRVARAKSLLEDPERSITTIALSLGFSTPQSFATAFKRYTGRTPTDYRLTHPGSENP